MKTPEADDNPKPQGWSIFKVVKDWELDGPHFWTTEKDSTRVNAPYWSHYDLLGLFLSLMGPAQPGATKLTFFLPLTAVYARWCLIIGGKATREEVVNGKKKEKQTVGTGVGATPTIAQCTWRLSKGEKGGYEFCLGSSLAGYVFKGREKVVGTWQRRLQMERFNLLKNYNHIDQMSWKAEIDDPDKSGQKKAVDVNWEFDRLPIHQPVSA